MSFKSFTDHLSETCNCWKGYKRKPGTAPCAEGSCIKEGKRGLWDNIHAKQKRIKAGSGEKMRTPGSEGAPTDAALKASQTNEASDWAKQAATAIAMKKVGKKPKNEEVQHIDEVSDKTLTNYVDAARKDREHNKVNKASPDTAQRANATQRDKKRIAGMNKANSYLTPGTAGHNKNQARRAVNEDIEAQFDLIESVVNELALLHNIDPEVLWEKFEEFTDEQLLEYAVDAKGHKSSTGGLTQKGRDAYNAHGAHLQAPVTTPPSKLKSGSKAANRRKSFCARMGGMEGPMKKPNGEPSRKALALRKWNC